MERSHSTPPVKVNATVTGETLLDWGDTPVTLTLGSSEKGNKDGQEFGVQV